MRVLPRHGNHEVFAAAFQNFRNETENCEVRGRMTPTCRRPRECTGLCLGRPLIEASQQQTPMPRTQRAAAAARPHLEKARKLQPVEWSPLNQSLRGRGLLTSLRQRWHGVEVGSKKVTDLSNRRLSRWLSCFLGVWARGRKPPRPASYREGETPTLWSNAQTQLRMCPRHSNHRERASTLACLLSAKEGRATFPLASAHWFDVRCETWQKERGAVLHRWNPPELMLCFALGYEPQAGTCLCPLAGATPSRGRRNALALFFSRA